jgi:hypothetical protein
VLVVGFAPSGCTRPSPDGTASAPAASPAAQLQFRDVAAEAGLQFTPDRSLKPPLDILQTAGYGGGFLDYDGDGHLDVLLVGNPLCALFRNLGNGRFQNVTEQVGLNLRGHWMGCASADYDNDGHADLFLSGYGTAALLHNEGGRFRRVPFPSLGQAWSTSAAFLDYDGDGFLDLYVGAYLRFGPGTPRFCPSGKIQLSCSPSHYDAERGRLFRNLNGAGFQDTTVEAGLDTTHGKTLGVAAADYDGDGRIDLYLANDGMPGDLFQNQGKGRFLNIGLESGTSFNREGQEQAGMGVDWGDVNGDTRLDLLVTTFQFEPTSLYLNGTNTFREEGYQRGVGDTTINTLGFGAKFLDADNDRDLDLLIANGHVQDAIGQVQPGVTFAQPCQLFRWEGERYAEVSGSGVEDLKKPLVGRGVAIGDYDNDGRLDALITNLNGTPLLLHNETTGSGHRLSLRLEFPNGPHDATGTVVTYTAAGRKFVRQVGTGGGYLSTSDPRVHLGLGAAARVEELTIRWPDGSTRSWRDLAADQELRLSPQSK